MTDERLPTELIIAARLRALQSQGIGCYIVRKGAGQSGSILLRSVMGRDASHLYVQSLLDDGSRGWMRVSGDTPQNDEKAQDYVARSVKRDPDLWVVEVEDRDGKNLFE
jgi:hypothetical protein